MIHQLHECNARKFTAAIVFSYVLMVAPLAMTQQSGDEAAIRQADTKWAKAAQTKLVDAWMAFYSDDAAVLPPNDQLASTKSAIRKSINDLLTLPELSITWEPTKVEVARSGDLGYSYGAYQLTFRGPDSKPVTDGGKYLEIWKKQKDGSWKCTVDTWNSDLPATASPRK